jgi:hypothetical protein
VADLCQKSRIDIKMADVRGDNTLISEGAEGAKFNKKLRPWGREARFKTYNGGGTKTG